MPATTASCAPPRDVVAGSWQWRRLGCLVLDGWQHPQRSSTLGLKDLGVGDLMRQATTRAPWGQAVRAQSGASPGRAAILRLLPRSWAPSGASTPSTVHVGRHPCKVWTDRSSIADYMKARGRRAAADDLPTPLGGALRRASPTRPP